ncbi:unnamed protein product [Brachionus calyciflorus]|uniref:Angiotensin-converting enzyme n=1 Tax=Brachionus calyciflorus TaxID=104777 RepID=A0A814BHS7_9BILA|nr:unnamed protein product [Brachionus calyciflorus]
MNCTIMFYVVLLSLISRVLTEKYAPYTEEQFQLWLDDWNQLTHAEMHLITKIFWSDEIASDDEIDVLESEFEKSIMLSANFSQEKLRELKKFDWRSFKDSNLKRAFLRAVIVIGDSGISDSQRVHKWKQIKSDMNTMYTTSKIIYKNKTLSLEPNLTSVFQSNRNYTFLRTMWKLWRDSSGKKLAKLYPEYINLSNEAVKDYDFKDYGEYSRSSFETNNLPDDLDEIYSQLEGLYKLLHRYVRKKLGEIYKLKNTGLLPAHILGDLWAQQWHNIFEDIKPYKNKTLLDVTSKMREKNMAPRDLFLIAEEFYTSLGLDPLPETFWNNSLFEKPNDGREVNCHASAWDFYDGKDFRIKMCTTVSMNDMFVVHHEMGHIQYYMNYKHQPFHFKEGANPGFHEALGDLMTLSVMTPGHLYKIKLIDELVEDEEQDINFLLFMALRNIAFAPFSLAVEKWRWSVFSGNTTPDNYNLDWWKFRCKYQGLVPPVDRFQDDFDPGSKYHIAAGVPYDRYFVSLILKFQFHETLCKASNHKGPLFKCDIYQSKEAGKKLKHMMEKGSSESWNKVLYEFTDGKTDKLDPSAMLEYFKPLHEWLLKQDLSENEWNCNDYLDLKNNIVHGYDTNFASRQTSKLIEMLAFLIVLFNIF